MSSWRCIFCGHSEETPIQHPPAPDANRDWHAYWKALRRRCPRCRCFLIPYEVWEGNYGKDNDKQIYEYFSQCPCAYQCSLHADYSWECEDRRFRPECLHVLHKRLDLIDHFQDKILSRIESLQGSRKARKRGILAGTGK